mgnify:CR=1 FL=1
MSICKMKQASVISGVLGSTAKWCYTTQESALKFVRYLMCLHRKYNTTLICLIQLVLLKCFFNSTCIVKMLYWAITLQFVIF